jgi:hypothetical protein
MTPRKTGLLPLMALLRHGGSIERCLLPGEDRKRALRGESDAIDPSRTPIGFQRGANPGGITAPTAFYNGRNVAFAVPTRLFLSSSPPSLERVSHPRSPQ